MADDIKNDELEVDTESEETQEDSQPEQKTSEDESKKTVSKDVKKLDENAEKLWESLSGKTQDRIVNLIRKNKALEFELATVKNQVVSASPRTDSKATPSEDEVKEAIKKLEGYGVVTDEKFENKLSEEIRRIEDRLYLAKEHERLERKYNGSDGRPVYNSEEVEDYARTHGGFGGNLEAAYREMNWDELIDLEAKNRKKKTQTYTEKPTVSARIGEKPLTLESLKERLAKPDGAEWWAKNREKIEPLMPKLTG